MAVLLAHLAAVDPDPWAIRRRSAPGDRECFSVTWKPREPRPARARTGPPVGGLGGRFCSYERMFWLDAESHEENDPTGSGRDSPSP